MKRLLGLTIAATLLLPGVLAAQPRRGAPSRERVGRISGIIADCERRTNEFKVTLARALEHSELRRGGREDQLNRDAGQLERAMNGLRESWNRGHDPERSRRNVRSAISAGRDINRTMARHRLRESVQHEWDVVRGELNRLAEAFDEPRIRW